jgi:hypothetical protein
MAYNPKYMESYRAANKRYRLAHPERVKAARSRWKLNNREKVLAGKKRWRAARPEYFKKYNAARKDITRDQLYHQLYGIGVREYNILLENQKDSCAICKRSRFSFAKKLAVDHDHVTGRVRGLLCGQCNTSLPLFENDSWRLNAIEYLQKEHV